MQGTLTYTEQKLWQLCLAHCKQAPQYKTFSGESCDNYVSLTASGLNNKKHLPTRNITNQPFSRSLEK